jgi:uncharacterized repeat protein (TIGR03803 family)
MLRVSEGILGKSSYLLRNVVTVLLLSIFFAGTALHAQTYTVIHDFTGGPDGGMPMAGLTLDRAGNLLGTANVGGNTGDNCGVSGCGLVYKLAKRDGNWVLTSLYNFQGGDDGTSPQMASVVVAPSGILYSTTYHGGGACGNGDGCGTVFKLQPRPTACPTVSCPWNETILHRFDGNDGAGPVGALLLDREGNLNGTTNAGNLLNGGTVYQLNQNEGTEQVLFHPYGYPGSGVNDDVNGNLYGSTFIGLHSRGTIYQLTQSGGTWVGTEIYDFSGGADGGYPVAGVILDGQGNLFGATTSGGSGSGGTVFELSPSGGSWTYKLLYSFAGPNNDRLVVGPVGNLVMDAAGNLYGTTISDGASGHGAVFKLTQSNGSWTYTSLHDFTGGSDGGFPYSNLVFGADGNIYGTASTGGAFNAGVIFEITP